MKSWKKMNSSRESTATRINGKTEAKDIADTFASCFESMEIMKLLSMKP